MNTDIQLEKQTSLNTQIEMVFNEVVKFTAILRTDITMNRPGDLYDPFCDFKESFDYLFSLSCNMVDHAITNKIDIWLNQNYHTLNIKDIKCGIDLFIKYKRLLMNNNIIKH